MNQDHRFRALMAVVFLMPVLAYAGDTRVTLTDLPAAVLRAVQRETKGTTIRSISRETENGRTVYEVETDAAGRTKDLLFDANGTILEIEEEIAAADVPAAALTAITRTAGRGKVTKIEKVTKGAAISYEAQIQGARMSEVVVRPDGSAPK